MPGANANDKKAYSTGEFAVLCGVIVRTVQYYDEKGCCRQRPSARPHASACNMRSPAASARRRQRRFLSRIARTNASGSLR